MVAQVALQLFHVCGVDGPPMLQVSTPMGDVLLEWRAIVWSRHGVRVFTGCMSTERYGRARSSSTDAWICCSSQKFRIQ
jgi:hypothetical protein